MHSLIVFFIIIIYLFGINTKKNDRILHILKQNNNNIKTNVFPITNCGDIADEIWNLSPPLGTNQNDYHDCDRILCFLYKGCIDKPNWNNETYFNNKPLTINGTTYINNITMNNLIKKQCKNGLKGCDQNCQLTYQCNGIANATLETNPSYLLLNCSSNITIQQAFGGTPCVDTPKNWIVNITITPNKLFH